MTETAAQPRQTPKATDARQEILRVAARMMRHKGYAEMSLRDLAAEVGMKAGSLYYHFPSKDALATEVMRLGVEVVHDAVSEALKEAREATSTERLVIALDVHLRTLISAGDFSSAHIRCYPFTPPAVRSELAAVRKRYNAVWDGLVREYLGEQATSQDIRNTRHVFLGALNWSLEWFDPQRDKVDDYIATMSRMLVASATRKT